MVNSYQTLYVEIKGNRFCIDINKHFSLENEIITILLYSMHLEVYSFLNIAHWFSDKEKIEVKVFFNDEVEIPFKTFNLTCVSLL